MYKAEYRQQEHDSRLTYLVNHLDEIGINRDNIISIIREPIWIPHGKNGDFHTLCDLLCLDWNNGGYCIELKHSWSQRGKARRQLLSGEEYMRDILNRSYSQRIIAIYTPDSFEYEMV